MTNANRRKYIQRKRAKKAAIRQQILQDAARVREAYAAERKRLSELDIPNQEIMSFKSQVKLEIIINKMEIIIKKFREGVFDDDDVDYHITYCDRDDIQSAIEYACGHGKTSVIQKYMQHELTKTIDFSYPVSLAAKNGHTSTVIEIVKMNVCRTLNPVLLQAIENKCSAITYHLINNYLDKIDIHHDHEVFFRKIIQTGDVDLVDRFIGFEVDVNVLQGYCLYLAAKTGKMEIVELLLSKSQFDANAVMQAIEAADKCGHTEISDRLKLID